MKSRKDMWSCQRSVLVGRLLKGKRQKVDNADLSQLSDYAAEVFYQFLLKVIKESSLFLGVTKTKTFEN